MPSKRRQINIRLPDQGFERIAALMERMRATLGIDVTQTDVITAALAELEKRYPPTDKAKPARKPDAKPAKSS